MINLDLVKLEEKLDKLNSEYGTKEKYCIFCGSCEYNSSIGIIHQSDCIILLLRKKIKKEKIFPNYFFNKC